MANINCQQQSNLSLISMLIGTYHGTYVALQLIPLIPSIPPAIHRDAHSIRQTRNHDNNTCLALPTTRTSPGHSRHFVSFAMLGVRHFLPLSSSQSIQNRGG